MTETISCPACFKVKRVNSSSPVCDSCIRLIPARLQAEYATAYMSSNKAEIMRLAAAIVTAANGALDVTWQNSRKGLTIAGAR